MNLNENMEKCKKYELDSYVSVLFDKILNVKVIMLQYYC